MKTLTAVLESAVTPLYESLLDDFDNLDNRQNTALRDELLKGTWFRLGSDMKTIIFDPEKIDHPADDRDVTPRLYWSNGKNHETNLSDVSVCKNLGLKFQPLSYVVDEIIGQDDDWLKHFDCEYVVTFIYSVQRGTHPTIDMSKIKFPITGQVAFTGYSTIEKIIAYPKPLERVRFLVQVHQPITGWNCKHMIISNANNIMFDLTKHDPDMSLEEKEQKLIEWVDELLKNNPDTETIYLGQFNRFTDHVKVITKGQGANRKCIKLAKFPDSKFRTLCHKNPTIEKMIGDVEAWRWEHADLYECDGATPGNTLGMGNPMVPTATEPGTEPIIPKHPRNKKDKKKMKSLKESLLDDFDTLGNNINPVQEIKNFIFQNYILHKDIDKIIKISNKPNKDGLYEVTLLDALAASDWNHQIEYLTNGLFIFAKSKSAKSSFQLFNCSKLKSIEGCPKEIGADFLLYNCPLLTKWKDIEKDFPKKIGGNFITSIEDPRYANKICQINGKIHIV